ncbi:hypothetical protein JX265_011823 [Neoarthrinium moseri]|uniref:Uncharacterized protein n=1 Tax=Neoarthrinium moseri TaxID=1658444 RepID=A0A9Q0AJ91_9PEZI|nr:uncharacterized protein JN550_010342 [Neoarthrinium moseri]KAI1847147.1 hypothetical protein JX266_006687 [Neoarthrinium moseri]KAI1856108.1 hypothetical protein JX265_011823 [Neoarthrinium moseri]KAI1862186.1 hypothetical protein JN550_010342 [Neoarthrinium moseri]
MPFLRLLHARVPTTSAETLRYTLLRPRRPLNARFSSNKPPSSSPDLTPKQQSRFDRILTRTQRWLPKRFHPTLQNFRAAPGSHVVAFLLVHEITAVLPIFGLVTAFRYYDVVPAGYVFGPWAPYVQEGAFKFLRWFRRKGWFGLGDEDTQEGERRLEEELGREADRERERSRGNPAGAWAFLGRLRGSSSKEDAQTVEMVEQARSKTSRAVEMVREKATLKNTESGYKLGVQLVAAYAITKVLLIPRIAFSLWATPSAARAMIWARRALFRR